MLRLIARIDTRNAHHIKTVRCEGTQKLRKVEDSIQEFSQGENEHDELILLDNVASLYGFENWLTRMDAPHMYCPLPLAIGGGIKSLEDATEAIRRGADKVVVNTAAINNHKLLECLAGALGSQAVVLQVDAKRIEKQYLCLTHGARELSRYNLVEWLLIAQDSGIGEVHVTSVDSEGTVDPFPEPLAEKVMSNAGVPVILSGGIRSSEDICHLHESYGVAAFSISSFTAVLGGSISRLRRDLLNSGMEVRSVCE